MNTSSEAACSYEGEGAPFNLTLFTLSVTLHICALMANSIVIIVYTRAGGLTSTQTFLRNLAAADFVYAFLTPFYVYRYAYPHLVTDKSKIDFVQAAYAAKYLTPPVHYTSLVASWFLVAATLIKYSSVYHSKLSFCLPPKKTSRVAVIILLACGVWAALDFVEKYFFDIIVDECSGYYFFGANHPLRKHDAYVYAVYSIWITVNHIAPSAIIILCNTRFVYTIFTFRVEGVSPAPSSGERSRNSDSLPHIPSVTRRELLIVVVVVTLGYIIFSLPAVIEQILWRVNNPLAPLWQRVSHTCLLTDHILNFLVYTFLSRHFRSLLLGQFRSCLAPFSQPSRSVSHRVTADAIPTAGAGDTELTAAAAAAAAGSLPHTETTNTVPDRSAEDAL